MISNGGVADDDDYEDEKAELAEEFIDVVGGGGVSYKEEEEEAEYIIIIITYPLTARVVWGTTNDFATNFLHFSLFSTALRDLANSRPVHSLMLSSHLFLCLPCLLPPFTVPCNAVEQNTGLFTAQGVYIHMYRVTQS